VRSLRPATAINWGALAAAGALAATLLGAQDLLGSGVFAWHLEQAAFRDGLIELAIVECILFVTLRLASPAPRIGLTALAVLAFARHHAIDLALVASGLYCIGIYGVGHAVDRWLFPGQANAQGAAIGRRVAIGLASLTVALWTPALIFGLSFEATRMLGLAFAAAGWMALGASAIRGASIPLGRPGRSEAAAMAIILVVCLAILARSNTLIYYDSIWYGLRPDRVLFGEHGIYNFLGLTTQIHYYPKLFEVALAPLQGWGDLSIDAGFNVWSLLLLALAIQQFASASGVDSRTSMLLAAALVCLPAFAGAAETTKGDVLAAAFVLFAARSLLAFKDLGAPIALTEVFVFAVLASGIRLAALPYLAGLFVATVFFWARAAATPGVRSMEWVTGRNGLLVLLAVAAATLVHYRTWELAGTPLVTNASTQGAFDRLGWSLRYPVGGLTGGEPARGLQGLIDFWRIALQPSAFQYQIFKWSGGLWISATAVCVLRLGFDRNRLAWLRGNAIPFLLGALLPLLLCFNSWPSKGGDGNYFLVPATCLCIAAWSGVSRTNVLNIALVLCSAIGLSMYLLTSNWVTGTTPWDRNFTRSPLDAEGQLARYLDSAELGGIDRFLRPCDPHTRLVGVLPSNGQAFALPVRYEPLLEMSWNNGESFRDPASFLQLLASTGTQLVVIPRDGNQARFADQKAVYDFTRSAMGKLAEDGDAILVAGVDGYDIYRMTRSASLRGCSIK
jgi:hypothetical protein